MNASLLLWVLLTGTPGTLSDHEALFERANQSYRDEHYEEALSQYETLLEKGVNSGSLHFNLGNTYLKNRKLGRAILHYAKARKYLPGDEDITANLAFADKQRKDPPIDGEDEAFSQTFYQLAHRISYPLVFNLAMALLGIGGIASLILIALPKPPKFIGYLVAIGCSLGILLTGAAWVQHKQITRNDLAVLVAYEANVYAGPSTRMNVSFSIHEGMRCRILESAEGWHRISLANGYNGWVPSTSIERI